MATVTVESLLTTALRRIKIIQEGEAPAAAMTSDGLQILNDLVDSLAGQSLMKYAVTRTTFTLGSVKGVPGNPYTVGTGGDVNIARPLNFHRVGYQNTALTPTIEFELESFTEAEYANIPQKALTGAVPGGMYYEPTFPLGSLYVWLVPTLTTLQGVLYWLTAIPEFAALTDVVSLPPGYRRFLRDQLALELWPEYREGEVPTTIQRSALDSASQIKSNNVRMTDLSVRPLGGVGVYNIWDDH